MITGDMKLLLARGAALAKEIDREEVTDEELRARVGESACANRPAPPKETLAEYLARVAREDALSSGHSQQPKKPGGTRN